MNTRLKTRRLAERIVELAKGEDPRVFLTALGVSIEAFVYGIWPVAQRREVLERHINHVKALAADDPNREAGFR